MNYLCIDIGGSKLLCGIADETGSLLCVEKEVLPLGHDAAYLLGEIHKLCTPMLLYRPVAAGISIPGLADFITGTWCYAPFSGIADFPIAEKVSAMFGIPAFADNDVNVCAIGEHACGCCRDVSNFLWITVSNGIGGAFFCDGHLAHGASNAAGEIGHFTVNEDNGRLCGCGKRGCLEAEASGTAIAAKYAEMTGKALDAKQIALDAGAGEPQAAAVYRQACEYLGKAIACAANLLNPAKVVLGGGVANDFELLLPMLKQSVEKRLFTAANSRLLLCKTELGYYAALRSCAILAAEKEE